MNGPRSPFASVALACLLAGSVSCGGRAPESFSVVLVTLDTTRADRIGAFGGTAVPTPNLDAAARDGVAFDQAISQVPLTLPAHASILTGRYPATHGVRHNGIYRLREEEVSLAERLRDAGFETAAFVGAYVLNRGFGAEQGFDLYDDVPVNRFAEGRDQRFEAQRTADDVNDRVRAWLDGRAPGRFFLWVHYYDPHDPYAPPEREGRVLRGEGYDREISYVDACFGDLLAMLRERGLLDRTLLAVVGDHGESLGEHGERTHGIFLYEGAVRVPFLLRAPGLIPAARRVAGPVELTDIAPTILDYLRLPPLDEAQGVSLRARVSGEDDGAAAVAFAETLMPRLEFGWSELRMIRDARFKYVDAPEPELYDLRADPGETTNLAPNDPERAAELASLLSGWVTGTEAQTDGDAGRVLTPDEEAMLRSLGYLGGDAYRDDAASGGSRPDPKAMMGQVRELDEARDALAAGDPSRALEVVDPILRGDPTNHQARNTRIRALLDLDRLPEARREAEAGLVVAETASDANPVLIEKARGMLASVRRLEGDLAGAERLYRSILEGNPDQSDIRADLATLLIETGRPDQAREEVERVLETEPRHGMALAVRFELEERAGETSAALRTAELLADARAGDAAALVRAGDLLTRDGQHGRAGACYETALDQTGLDPGLMGKLGLARLRSGDLDSAREVFLALNRLRPGDPRSYQFLGVIALERGDEAQARSWFERALEADPRFTAPLVGFGRWLVDQGRLEEAEQTLEDALARNPSDGAARRVLEDLRSRGRR